MLLLQGSGYCRGIDLYMKYRRPRQEAVSKTFQLGSGAQPELAKTAGFSSRIFQFNRQNLHDRQAIEVSWLWQRQFWIRRLSKFMDMLFYPILGPEQGDQDQVSVPAYGR